MGWRGRKAEMFKTEDKLVRKMRSDDWNLRLFMGTSQLQVNVQPWVVKSIASDGINKIRNIRTLMTLWPVTLVGNELWTHHWHVITFQGKKPCLEQQIRQVECNGMFLELVLKTFDWKHLQTAGKKWCCENIETSGPVWACLRSKELNFEKA